jgi:hypothetical protein
VFHFHGAAAPAGGMARESVSCRSPGEVASSTSQRKLVLFRAGRPGEATLSPSKRELVMYIIPECGLCYGRTEMRNTASLLARALGDFLSLLILSSSICCLLICVSCGWAAQWCVSMLDLEQLAPCRCQFNAWPSCRRGGTPCVCFIVSPTQLLLLLFHYLGCSWIFFFPDRCWL